MTDNICSICQQNPAFTTLMVQRNNSAPEEKQVCESCLVQMTDTNPLLKQLQDFFGPVSAGPSGAFGFQGQTAVKTQPEKKLSKTPALDQFGRDLTNLARQGKLDPVIGREDEINQALEVLSRRRKNNVALIGEPGVGKTAVVEGIARKVHEGSLPDMADKRVVELDLSGMIAGAQYRGQFEQRFKALVEELSQSQGQIILFIDEMHTLVGAGSAEGAMDAANMLKPLLARGELQLIGATTLDEYRKGIEKDGALARRFSTVYLEEPSLKDTEAILTGLKASYEEHHGLKIGQNVIQAAVRLSDRYLHEGRMPDKAIDLLDQAAARWRREKPISGSLSKEIQSEIAQLENAKQTAIAREDFEYANECKKKIQALQKGSPEGTLEVDSIASVIASKTGIPVNELGTDEMEKLRNLHHDLHQRVIGQDKAVNAVADAVRSARAGLTKKNGPIGTFLFLGPTGVGKTELAKTLAQRLFGSEDALVRIDMSEFREPHTVSRLIGSPPGYVGYGQGGQLTEPVRRRPYRVLLLDEIEKAHPDIWNVFLQVFDDGRLTDGEGRTVVFDDCVIIMTSNLGARMAKKGTLGFVDQESDVQQDVAKTAFPPELWNRIDEAITFDALSEENILAIAERIVEDMSKDLQEQHGAQLTLSKEALQALAKGGFDPEYGARPLKRYIKKTLVKQIVDAILQGDVKQGTKITFDKDLKVSIQ